MLKQRLKLFLNPNDGRFEDLARGNVALNVLRDLTAGLVVAAVAIPLAMGFAMASGLRPEQGIVGGAVAGLIGALFGGSKYQVYGPTAAFIPIIGAIMAEHDHAFLVACSMVAGVALWLMGLLGFGRIVKLVPHSIVVGFTIGIAVTIAVSQGTEVLGVHAKAGYGTLDKLRAVVGHFGELNLWAVLLAVGTVVVTKLLLRISVYIPAPLVALGIGVLLGQTALADAGLDLVRTKYGAIPPQGLHITPPSLASLDPGELGKLAYYAVAIVFVSAIESLLCSRMADRLAGNQGQPFNADKELWGQGHVMIFVPLLNGFPHTGALARTATNIKLGAISPLAGVFKFALKLALAFYLARYLELVPMACIGGILLYVAMNMVKRGEIDEVLEMGRAHVALMAYTAIAVVTTDFLRGVLSALALYAVGLFVARSRARVAAAEVEVPSVATTIRASVEDARRSRRLATARAPERAHDGHGAHAGHHGGGGERRKWLAHIRQPAIMARSAYVHHQANVIGRVVLGDSVHIAAGASVRADEGSPFYIGSNTNIQDGVVIHALKDRHVLIGGEPWAVYIGRGVSLAHDALVHGPCYVGDGTFVGFKAVVHDATIGPGCFLGIGSIVVGVEVPEGRFVPPGTIVDTAEKVAALGPVTEAHREFNADVVEVNRGLAAAYREQRLRASGASIAHPPDGGWSRSDAAGWGPPASSGGVF